MPLPLQSDTQLVNSQAAVMQAYAGQVLDFTVGSTLRALIESNMGNTLALQALIVNVLASTRLLTSTGTQVDTFIGDYGLTRLPPFPASGQVTFSRFTDTAEATIPSAMLDANGNLIPSTIATLVSSIVNGVSYAVYADTANSYYSPDRNAYVIPVNTPSISVPIISVTSGIVGNVLSNQITTISTVLINVDNVTNSSALVNGKDAETDNAAKARFILYINSLSKATYDAISFALSSISGLARFIIVEFVDINNNPMPGYFYVVIDDGTGNASGTLLANAQAAVYAVRALGIAFAVLPPTPLPMSVVATVSTDGSVEESVVHENIATAYENYVSAQGFNALFAYSRVPAIIYGADSSITDVTSYTLNGGTSDVQATGEEIMTTGTLTINFT